MPGQYGKNRSWWAVLYNENMRPDWRDEVSNLVQLPFAYCVHDKGLQLEDGEKRKVHTHMILVWPAPTTYKHACEVFGRLSLEGKRAFNAIEPVYNSRHAYDYLIHDTEDCRKKGKFVFPREERVTGNLYDIGNYEQVSVTEKNEAFDRLTELVLVQEITNYADFVEAAIGNYPDERDLMRDVIRGYSGYFDRLIKGVYLRGAAEFLQKRPSPSTAESGAALDPEIQRKKESENLTDFLARSDKQYLEDLQRVRDEE